MRSRSNRTFGHLPAFILLGCMFVQGCDKSALPPVGTGIGLPPAGLGTGVLGGTTPGALTGPLAPVTGFPGTGLTKTPPVGLTSLDTNLSTGGTGQVNSAVLDISVSGGYQPSVVTARAGQPVALRFTRRESSACGAQVRLTSLGKSANLPVGQPVVVQLPALAAGRYDFTCGMNMYRGTLVVQ